MDSGHMPHSQNFPLHGNTLREAMESLRRVMNAMAPCRRSRDCCSVVWYGVPHAFTAAQGAVISQLWEAWENGTPDLRQETLTSAYETKRLKNLFKDHAAWGAMIKPGLVKGSYRLADPWYEAPASQEG